LLTFLSNEKSQARPAGQNHLKRAADRKSQAQTKTMITTTTTITNNELQATNNKRSNPSNIPPCGRVKNPSIGLRQLIEKTPRLFLTRFFVYFFIEKSKARPAGQNNIKEPQATS
jgi:hypothetical protein